MPIKINELQSSFLKSNRSNLIEPEKNYHLNTTEILRINFVQPSVCEWSVVCILLGYVRYVYLGA